MSDVIKKAEQLLGNYKSATNLERTTSLEESLKRLEKLNVEIYKGAPIFAEDNSFRVVFAFDTTDSMSPCIDKVTDSIENITKELLIKEPEIYMMVAGVGEYREYPLQMKSYTKDIKTLKRNIKAIRHPTDGWPAAQVSLELLFQKLNKEYISGNNNALVVVTDQIAHGQDEAMPYPKADYRKE